MRILPAFALTAFFLLSGCATLFSGTEERVRFYSEPPGANIIIDGITVGTTPSTVVVERPGLGEKEVVVELEGYEPRTFKLDKEFNATSILNVFFWPGFVIDALSGALFGYGKNVYEVDLQQGAVSLHLHELPRGREGEYLLPDTENALVVTDEVIGLTLRFE